MEEHISTGFPVYAAVVDGEYAGYAVCRVEDETVWGNPSSFGRNIAVEGLLPLCISRQRRSPLLVAKRPYTITFTPTIIGRSAFCASGAIRSLI